MTMKSLSVLFAFLGCLILPQIVVAQYVRGQVIEEISRNPIPGAYLKCYPDSVYCFTDSLGFFSFDGIKHNRIDIEAQCMGYESALMSQILTTSSKDLVVTIELKDKSNDLDEVVVSARHPKLLPQNEMALTSSRSFSVEECRRFAGGLDDPARMASNFAGCGSTSPGSNAIIVRGNAPASVLWRLEGVDIPSPVHFNGSSDIPGGGLYTIFSSFMLANSEFYSGCFPAEYFNTVGGIFNIKFRSGNPWKHEYSAQLGVQGLDLSAEGPISRKNGSTFICNVRLSTLQLLKKLIPELSEGQSVNYQDYCAKFDIPDTKIGRVSIWGIMGNSKLTQDASNDPGQWSSPNENTDASMKNLVLASGISNEYTVSPSISMKNTIAVTRDCQYFNYGERRLETPETPASDYEFDDKCTSLIISSTLNQRLSTQTIGRYGITYKHIWDNCRSQFGTYALIPLCDSLSMAHMIQGHAQIKHALSKKITSIIGGSVTYFSLAKECAVEPRLGFEYKPRYNNSIAMGISLHSQTVPLYFYMIDTGNANNANEKAVGNNHTLKMMRAVHLTGSYNLIVSPICHLKFEPYFQYLYNVPNLENSTFSIINMVTQPSNYIFENCFVNNGAGINTGIDVTFERFLSRGYYYMGTLSIFKSEYRDFFNNWHPTMFDARWYLNVLGGKELTFKRKNGLYKVLGLNGHIMVSGRSPYSPVDYEKSHSSHSIVYDESLPFSFRKKGVNILADISLTYMVNYKSFSGTIALQVKNLFGRQYIGQFYNLLTDTVDDMYFESPIPLLSYKIEF